MTRIATLTMNPAVDTSTTVDRVVPEHKLRCAPLRREAGGGGLNVSRAIRNLGGDSTAIYPAGGLTGRMLQDTMEATGIDHCVVAIEQATRENFLLKPNLRELSHLADRPLEDVGPEEAARGLVGSDGAEVVMVSLGAAGAFLASSDLVERIRAPTVPIRSKVGAGDSMVAGLVLALARGWSLGEAARFGVAAGAAAVMTPGTERCRREDTERLYAHLREER